MAEKGIYQVAGSLDSNPQSFEVSKQNQQVEVKVLGKSYVSELPKKYIPLQKEETHPPEELKQQKSDYHITFLSRLGNKLGEIFQIGAEKGMKMLVSFIKEQ